MPLQPGERLGPYEILALAGEGGMGQVWKARDTRLNRLVAIKTTVKLNDRFEREAHAIAALNHPNICSLYDIGPDYLVMEYVEGAPLKGPLPLDLALKAAGQILDALDAAHRKGITHRDLKPGNILMTSSGIKLLDFGLAKTSRVLGLDESTVTAPLTGDGTILGTLQYMSPEQLEGKEADARSDIFSFGLVLYELLAGRRAFQGATQASLMASILKEQPPPLSGAHPAVPKSLDRVIETCLEKDPEKRWQSAREVKHALEWAAGEEAASAPAAPAGKGKLRAWQAIAAVLALAAVGVAAWALWPKPATLTRFQVDLPQNVTFSQYVSVSPDGRKLLFNAVGEQSGLWIRDLDTLQWRHLSETDGAVSPFWSPDSRYVGFAVGNKLKKMSLDGGPPQTLSELSPTVGTGSWSKDGVIIFGTRSGIGTLHRVPEAGGTPVEVTRIDPARGETFHALPSFLPDGKHFLYLRQGTDQVKGIYVGSLDAKPEEQSTDRLATTQYAAEYADGHMFFMHDNTLMAQPLDAGSLKLKGEPIPVAENVQTTLSIGVFSVSSGGVLAYRSGNPNTFQLTWFDAQGNRSGTAAPQGPYEYVQLSPDGTRVAARDNNIGLAGDLWTLNLARGVWTRLTFRQSLGSIPLWSPDGAHIAFAAGTLWDTIFQKESSGTGEDQPLYSKAGEIKTPTSWSSDGRFILYNTSDTPGSKGDVWALPVMGAAAKRQPVPLLKTEFNETGAVFSPDMHWIAYASDESGTNEVYVRPFLASGPSGSPSLGDGKWQISKGGGSSPKWRNGGKEIVYQMPPLGTVKMAVQVKANGSAFEAGIPQKLFQAPVDYGWDVTADGKKLLLAIEPNQTQQTSTPITVVLNWQALLKK